MFPAFGSELREPSFLKCILTQRGDILTHHTARIVLKAINYLFNSIIVYNKITNILAYKDLT